MITISRSLRDLRSEITALFMHCAARDYPTSSQTHDEAWDNLEGSLAYLRSSLGSKRYVQLIEMAAQSKAHFDSDEIKLGVRLMQDMGEVVKGKPPFAYPEEMYRWPRIA